MSLRIRQWLGTIAGGLLLAGAQPAKTHAAPVIVARMEREDRGRTLKGELRFDVAGGPVSGHARLVTVADAASRVKRKDGSPVAGRFEVELDLKADYPGGPLGVMSGEAQLAGSFITHDGTRVGLSNAGRFTGRVGSGVGVVECRCEWERVLFDGGDIVPQPLSIDLIFAFEPTLMLTVENSAATPREASVNVLKAFETGDKALYLATVHIREDEKESAGLAFEAQVLWLGFLDAMRKAYGQDIGRGVGISPRPSLEQMEKEAVVEESGDKATATIPGHDPLRLVRVGGAWKADIELAHVPASELPEACAMIRVIPLVREQIGKPGVTALEVWRILDAERKKAEANPKAIEMRRPPGDAVQPPPTSQPVGG